MTLSLLSAAAVAQESATVHSTQDKRVRAWKRWTQFLPSVGIEGNDLLETFTPSQKITIFTAFCQSVREGDFSKDPTRAGTIRDTIQYVSQAFKASLKPDPTSDLVGNRAFLIRQTLKGYENLDPPPKQQKALPFCIIEHAYSISQNSPSSINHAIARLSTGAFFHMMRSCEYSKTSFKDESKQTKILQINNFCFFKGNQQVDILTESADLKHADYVDIHAY